MARRKKVAREWRIFLIGNIIIKNGRDRARVDPVGDVEIGKRGRDRARVDGVGRLLERRAECAAVLVVVERRCRARSS